MHSTLARFAWLRRLRAVVYRRWHGTTIHRQGPNHIIHWQDSLLHACRVELLGENNTLLIGPGARLWNVNLRLVGVNLRCEIGAQCRLRGGQYQLEDQDTRLFVGAGTTCINPTIIACEGGVVSVGNGCLIAAGADIRNSDAHSILDAASGERLNPAADIRIADHAWIGLQAQVLKGVTIGNNAIVGARSVVTKDVASGTLVAGVPARIIREAVNWDHRRLQNTTARSP